MNMQSGEFIISFGDAGLSGLSQTWHRILSLLSERYRIMHVLPNFYLQDAVVSLGEKKRRSGLRSIDTNLYEYQPPWFLPKNYRYPAANTVVDRITLSLIRRTAAKLGCDKPILYIWHPRYAKAAGSFDEKLVCYHVYDDCFSYETCESIEVYLQHERLLQRADLVFATSRPIIRSLELTNGKAHYIPNGADYERFESASRNRKAEPPDIAEIPHPRIGYTGNINIKVDFGLLEYLARKHSEWSFILIGPLNAPDELLAHCRKLPNLYFPGEKEYKQIPDYVAAMDVCIMPYVLKGWVLSGYPLKMHEYLAAGKPVVSADLESVREFKNVIQIVKSAEEWESAIKSSIKDASARVVASRRQVASENNWRDRAYEIDNLIRSALSARRDASWESPGIKRVLISHE